MYNLKQRAIKIALDEKAAEVAAAKGAKQRLVERVLSFDDVKRARGEYVDAMFKSALSPKNSIPTDEAYKKYTLALSLHGLNEEDLEWKPSCPFCKDTGRVGTKLCACTRPKYLSALKSLCDIESRASFTFDDANFGAIKSDKQRESLKKLYEFGIAYANKVPLVKAKTLVFCGGVGTGKTCLASAIARETLERGKSVAYLSAYEFASKMLAAHTSPIQERNNRLADYLTADLLVIDDLGTEPMLKNVTIEYLLLVIEERTNHALPTLITTNLSPARILDRYGERIYSRLSSKNGSRIFAFDGKDLRIN